MGNGALKGHAPEIFDGQRKNASKFMREFGLWKICNIRNESMMNPFQRVALALSYIKGPRVDDWVLQQGDELAVRVQGDTRAQPPTPPTHNENDEWLWTHFVDEFQRAFTDTASAEQAYEDLTKLEMKGDDVDEYVAAFERLIVRAGWERNAKGSLEMFKQGLRKGLHYTILQRDPMPQNLDEWQAAARREVQRRRLVVASLGPRGGDFLTTRQNRRRDPAGRPTYRPPKRDPDAMDVDAVTTGEGPERANWRERSSLTEAERKKRQSEGRCFLCGRQGHMRRACPKKNENRGEKRGREERARAVTMEENQQEGSGGRNDDAPAPPAYNPDSLISHIKTLGINERDDLLDKIMEEGAGF